MSKYSTLLKEAIKNSGKTLTEIFLELHQKGIKVSQSYLSLLQNGKSGPASDEVNKELAIALGLDEDELIIASYEEKIPTEVLDKLVERRMASV